MTVGSTIQGFTGGILSPEIHGRQDFNKVQLGLADASNITIRPTGAAGHRVGTTFVTECKYSDKEAVLVKFGSTRQAVYAIELGDQYMRFIRNGAAVVDTVAITNGDFTSGIAGWTDISTGAGSISHNAVDGRMVLDDAVAGATQAITTVVDQDYTVSFDVVGNPIEVAIGTTSGGSEVVSKTSPVGTGRNITFKATATTTYISFKQNTASVQAELDNVSAVEPVELATPYLEADLPLVRYVQQGESLYMVHPSYPPKKLTRTSDTVWSFVDSAFNPDATNVVSLTLVKSGTPTVAKDFTWGYTVSTIYEDEVGNLVESLPYPLDTIDADIDLGEVQVVVTFQGENEVTNKVKRYHVYRKGGGEPQLINIIEAEAVSDANKQYTFDDTGLEADASKSPVDEFTYFASTNQYPISVGVYNQRLVYGGTNERPDVLWFSRVQDFDNFTATPVLAENESFSKVLSAGETNRAVHLQSLDDLMCLTDGKIWRIKGTNNNDLNAFIESSIGAGDARPIPSRKSMLFVESNQNTVSDFIYRDTVAGYDGDKLDILSRSLFRQFQIKDISFQDSPDGLLHTVRSDGKMPVLTYLKNQDVYAWSYYETAGDFERILSIDKDVFDDTYVIVKRTINGQTRRFIELFQYQFQDAEDTLDDWFVDSGLKYSGNPISIVCGLDHLIGETVRVYADGDDLEDYTVDSDGCIDFGAESFSNILVGLPYESVMQVITTEVSERSGGTTIGKTRRVVKCAMSLLNSRGYYFSSDGVNYTEAKSTDATMIGDPIPKETKRVVFEVESSMDRESTLYISQKRPLPLIVLNITMDLQYGER